MGGLLLGMGWDGGVGDDGARAGKQASGVNRLRFPFFSLFGFRAFHLFSSILLCYRLVYFIFRSFCLLFFFSPTSSSNQSLIHIYQVGRRTVWMPTANYHSLLCSTAFSYISKRERRAPGTSLFLFRGLQFGYILFFREGVYFYFLQKGAHGFLRYIRCKPVLLFLYLFVFLFLGVLFIFMGVIERVKYVPGSCGNIKSLLTHLYCSMKKRRKLPRSCI